MKKTRMNGLGFSEGAPVPIYEIPEDLRRNSLKYMLPDGNKRWLYGHATAGKVATILLQSDEKIRIDEWHMAPFRHANHPKIYERTLGIYRFQEINK